MIKICRDWQKITTKDIREHGGGQLLTYYHGTMFNLLSSLYPGNKLLKNNQN